MPKLLPLIPIVCGIILPGCSTEPAKLKPPPPPQVRVSAVADPNYSIPVGSLVAVRVATNAIIETRRAARLLEKDLTLRGFQVVEQPDARFVAWCAVAGNQVQAPDMVFSFTHLYVTFYSTAELMAGKVKSVWEGQTWDMSSKFDPATERFIKTLDAFVGKDFDGFTPLLQ